MSTEGDGEAFAMIISRIRLITAYNEATLNLLSGCAVLQLLQRASKVPFY